MTYEEYTEMMNENNDKFGMSIEIPTKEKYEEDQRRLDAEMAARVAAIKLESEKEYLRQYDCAVISAFGKHYYGKDFTNFIDDKKLIPQIEKAISENKSIYLYGVSRKGKTHLACGIYKKLWNGDRDRISCVKCVNLDILISDYQNEKRMDHIDDIKQREYLILDDIGVGKLTQERHSMYYYIIDYRLSNDLCTIYTSNYKTSGLWQGSNDIDPTRIITRIQESCVGFQLE